MHESNFIGIPIYHLQGIFEYQYWKYIYISLEHWPKTFCLYIYDGHDGIYVYLCIGTPSCKHYIGIPLQLRYRVRTCLIPVTNTDGFHHATRGSSLCAQLEIQGWCEKYMMFVNDRN